MAFKAPPPSDNDENPPWTKDDFARARPAAEVLPPSVMARARRGRPPKPDTKVQVSLRLDPDVLEAAKAGGPGWQGRINQILRVALKSDLAQG